MDTTPKVSVLMTAYCGGSLVLETVDSILNQTLTDFELIIVDDCSKDNTYELLSSVKDERVRLFRNDENIGISRTRNRALSLATGEFIAATDQDDLSMPSRLEKEASYLEANPQVSMVASAAKQLRKGKIKSLYPGESRPYVIAWQLYTRSSIVHSSIMFRRKYLQQYDISYKSEYHYAEDFVLFNEFSKVGDISILPDELVIYREHDTNASRLYNEEMIRNGAAFLRYQYEQELGINVDEELMLSSFRIFNLGQSPRDEGGLLNAGRLYELALNRYIEKNIRDNTKKADLLDFGANDWWRAVRAFSKRNRYRNVRNLYFKLEKFSKFPPKSYEIYVASIRARLGI